LQALSDQAAIAIDNARLYSRVAEEERIRKELEIARRIQMSLIPSRFPAIAGYEASGRMSSAKEIGGDYYDFIEGSDRLLRIVVGDVSGKGIPAGLFMVMARTIVRSLAGRGRGPKEILALANNVLHSNIEEDEFMSMILLSRHPDEERFLFTNAGHEGILHYKREEDEVFLVPPDGFALGIFKDIDSYLHEGSIVLKEGDFIAAYSDGIIECRNRSGTLYGIDRFKKVLKRNARADSPTMVERVFKDLGRFMGGREQADDMTLVLVKKVSSG
jgi:serine phosphatase RsbU (regulator of sigma subunit)